MEFKMTTQELIEALDQRYGNPNAKGLELIQEAIRVLRYQHEELEALMDQIK
jgi:predicted phage tail protein